jgi:hypothetical protein
MGFACLVKKVNIIRVLKINNERYAAVGVAS